MKTPILLLALLLSGCATDVAHRYYGGEKFPPRPVEEVALLRAAPDRGYDVIADFQLRNASPGALQKLAAKIGADAVIVTGLGGLYNPADVWAGQDSQAHTFSHLVGTAIRYKIKP